MPKQLKLPETLNEKMGQIRDAQKQIDEARKQYVGTMKRLTAPIIEEMGAEIMRAHPEITSIRWSQYTPYFNDGSPCTFQVYEPEFSFTESFVASLAELQYEEYVCENGEGFYSILRAQRGTPEFLKKLDVAQENFYLLLKEFDESLEDVFGNHSQVTLKRNGTIRVKRCDHD